MPEESDNVVNVENWNLERMSEYMDLKDPEGEKLYRFLWDGVTGPFLKGRSTEELQKQYDESQDALYEKWVAPGSFFTGKEVRMWRMGYLENERAKNTRKPRARNDEKRHVAYRAFMEVDTRGGSSAEAVQLAHKAVASQFKTGVSKQTIRVWLNEILHCTDIEKSKPGFYKPK